MNSEKHINKNIESIAMANKTTSILFLIILSIFLLIPITLAQFDSSLYGYRDLYLDLDISSQILLEQQTGDYTVNYVQAELAFYPAETYRQTMVSFNTYPDADVEDNEVIFYWQRPFLGILDYGLNAQIHTTNEIYEIKNKIIFPMNDLPSSYDYYLQETPLIDLTKGIETRATDLAVGEDDAFIVAWKMADWVKSNIEYDLNTVTAEASLPSSWVLESGQGVCDEITNLFLSMVRSVGIPARFVTGMAFTTSTEFSEQFGPHGWAEVYFPSYGWVPFDVTYGQYGFLDATHIKFRDSLDSDRSSVKYEWESYGIDVIPSDLDMDVDVASTGSEADLPFEFDVNLIYPNLSFGSYSLIEARVENLEDYYVPVVLYLSQSTGYDIFDGTERSVILTPNEETSLYWIIQIDQTLNNDYEYYFDGAIYTMTNESTQFSFSSKKTDPHYSLSDIRELYSDKSQELQKTYSSNINISCNTNTENTEFYSESAPKIQCILKNTGNTIQEGIEVCYDDSEQECSEVDLGLADEETIEFNIEDLVVGQNLAKITARNSELYKTDTISYTILDNPKILISDITYPEEVELNKKFTLLFNLDKNSLNTPKNVNVEITYGKTTQTLSMDELEEITLIEVEVLTNDFTEENTNFYIQINYEDNENHHYIEQTTLNIKLINLSWWDKVKLFLKGLF
jgi:transglutaminase-like putative cysteine protease